MTMKDDIARLGDELAVERAANEELRKQVDQLQDEKLQMRYVETIDRTALNAQRCEMLAQEVLWLRGVIERMQGLTEPSAAYEEMLGTFRNRSTWSVL
jgi:hypothetical protein